MGAENVRKNALRAIEAVGEDVQGQKRALGHIDFTVGDSLRRTLAMNDKMERFLAMEVEHDRLITTKEGEMASRPATSTAIAPNNITQRTNDDASIGHGPPKRGGSRGL